MRMGASSWEQLSSGERKKTSVLAVRSLSVSPFLPSSWFTVMIVLCPLFVSLLVMTVSLVELLYSVDAVGCTFVGVGCF